ncbi:MAG: hypothetical protein HC842_09250, partial [Cytophagales bacterium]|nr:hypothetical protein [Cytophagales bacterium]
EAEFHTFKSKQCIQGDPCAAFTESEQHMAEWVLRKVEELENLRLIQVQEHIHLDPEADFGIGLEIGLNVERINPFVINRLVCDFKAGTFQPDDTRYSHFPD